MHQRLRRGVHARRYSNTRTNSVGPVGRMTPGSELRVLHPGRAETAPVRTRALDLLVCPASPPPALRARTLRRANTMALDKRRLGTTDLEITTVGFGAWAIGGGGWAYGWGPQDDAGSISAIRHPVPRGVNWIDTAAIYGLGPSEGGVGR